MKLIKQPILNSIITKATLICLGTASKAQAWSMLQQAGVKLIAGVITCSDGSVLQYITNNSSEITFKRLTNA